LALDGYGVLVNREWIAFHLAEARQELDRTLADLARDDYDEVEFGIAMAHAYNHLNTAWNARRESAERVAAHTDADFYRWRAFPSDIDMAR
jgi:hypothetical protein